MSDTLGLIAGGGALPQEIARAARRRGRDVAAVAFRDITPPELACDANRLCWLQLGEMERLVSFFHGVGARDAVLAGKISKTYLYRDYETLRLDARALALLARLSDRGDGSILAMLAQALDEEGIRILPQAALVPELLPEEGVLGRVEPTGEQWRDLAFAWPVAKALGGLDVGQSVVVQEGAVLAVEAIEGTDAAIRRAGALGRPGACVVKVAKPDQDLRFDLPAVGLGTLESVIEARAAVLAFEAHQTIVLDRSRLVERADACGVAVVSVPSKGPGPDSGVDR